MCNIGIQLVEQGYAGYAKLYFEQIKICYQRYGIIVHDMVCKHTVPLPVRKHDVN